MQARTRRSFSFNVRRLHDWQGSAVCAGLHHPLSPKPVALRLTSVAGTLSCWHPFATHSFFVIVACVVLLPKFTKSLSDL